MWVKLSPVIPKRSPFIPVLSPFYPAGPREAPKVGGLNFPYTLMHAKITNFEQNRHEIWLNHKCLISKVGHSLHKVAPISVNWLFRVFHLSLSGSVRTIYFSEKSLGMDSWTLGTPEKLHTLTYMYFSTERLMIFC